MCACACARARASTHTHMHNHYVRMQMKTFVVCGQCYVFAEAPSLIELALEKCRRLIVKLPLLLQIPHILVLCTVT